MPPRRTPIPRRPTSNGPAGLVLALALLVPLGVIGFALMQLPTTGQAAPTSLVPGDPNTPIIDQRPAPSNPPPPPTLAPPTLTPVPTATPVPPTLAPQPTARPLAGSTYTVQPGDQLKDIAAEANVSIWQIIATNNISNPDSLRVGQVLHIPDN